MDAIGAFENYIFPHFYDFQLKTTLPIHQDHIFTTDMLISGDALKVKLENPDHRADALADSGNLGWSNKLTLASLDWKWFLTPQTYSHLTLAYSKQPFDSEVSGIYPQWFKGQVHNVDLNADWTILSIPNHELEAGWYLRGSDAHLDINLKQDYFLHSSENSNVALDTTMLLSSIDKKFYYAGCYIQDEWEITPPVLRVGYGLRCEAMNTSPATPLSPRFHLIYRLTEDTRIKFSWGHFNQFSIDPTQVEPPLGSNQLKPKKAIHYILGWEHEPTENSKIRIEGYIKELSHLFVFSPDMKFTNYGRGKVHGLEFFFESRPFGRLDGWASYSYSVATRKDLAGTPEYHPLQDQTHTASLVVNYKFDPRWRLSWKWLAHSGRPYTPVTGVEAVVDSITGAVTSYIPIEGDINSKRFPSYQRLDMHLDRDFQFNGWDMDVYLEVLNVYCHRNVYDYSYTKDYSRRITTYQFPLLPSIGIKVMF
jgi:outer membrane receptor protein involved in Fe transport